MNIAIVIDFRFVTKKHFKHALFNIIITRFCIILEYKHTHKTSNFIIVIIILYAKNAQKQVSIFWMGKMKQCAVSKIVK